MKIRKPFAATLLFISLLTPACLAAQMVTFDLKQLDAPRRGNIGFLASLVPNALPKEWVTDIKPVIWRGTISSRPISDYYKPVVGLHGVDGYPYLHDVVKVPV